VLRRTVAAQHGVVTRAQLRAAGVPVHRLGTVERPAELVRVRYGAYVTAERWAGADQAERTCLRVVAERLVTGRDVVAVRRTAALAHGLPVLGRPSRLELAERKQDRPDHHGTARWITESEVEHLHGAAVTSPARTAVDVARSGFAAGVVTADAVLRRGTDRAELELAVDVSRRWPGRLTAQRVAVFADPLAETALESLGRARFEEVLLALGELQVWLGDEGGPFARVDHCWREQRTVAEADGALKYTGPPALFEEKRREDRLREAGWEVVRYTWDEVLRTPEVAVARVRRAFARAARRAA
jgi:hypothetical protein